MNSLSLISNLGPASASSHSGLPEVSHQPVLDIQQLKNSVIEARGDINQIRMLLKGNVQNCKELFMQAVRENDAITQIQLSHAFFGMKRGQDHMKDFSNLAAQDLEEFFYYPREFGLFNSAYDELMGVKSDLTDQETRASETFITAASRGYLPALLELKHKEWKCCSSSFGFAVQLLPFVGKGDSQLDYFFGRALKNGCEKGSDFYYEGMYWMNQSLGIPVQYPDPEENFESFKHRYFQSDSSDPSYDHDGFTHVGDSVVLAPSREHWAAFVKEKLESVRTAKSESYLFHYDPREIKDLFDRYEIQVAPCNLILQPSPDSAFSSDQSVVEELGETRDHVLRVYDPNKAYFAIYQQDKLIGEITVEKVPFKITHTFENSPSEPIIRPIIDFIGNVMIRKGSARSALSWLEQIKEGRCRF